MECLKRAIESRNIDARVVLVEANEGKTTDGVEAGGERVAQEVIKTITDARAAGLEPSRLSVVGNSLGGLYARWAVAHLFDADTQLVAGLRPEVFLTVATPHLGVREFTWPGIPVPRQLHFFATIAAGRSGEELYLSDRKEDVAPLLLRMATEERFLAPLRSFKRRVAFANAGGDFLVPFETAAFAALPRERLGGPMSLFETLFGLEHGRFTQIAVPSPLKFKDPTSDEARMAQGLDSMKWTKVAVEFGGAVPLSHNRICALNRGPVSGFLYKSGAAVMEHAAQLILDEEEAAPLEAAAAIT